MKKLTIITVISLIFSISCFTQNISGVNARVDNNNQVVINYNVSDIKLGQILIVSLYISNDDGNTYTGPLKNVSGDISDVSQNGKYQIIWDFQKERNLLEEDLIFDVRARIKVKKSFFVSYIGNSPTYLGLRLGLIGRVGWYIEGRGNLLSKETASYDIEDGMITNFNKPGYYEFTNDKGWSAYSFLVGLNYQFIKNLYLYGGIGYGKEEYLYKINEFQYEDDLKTSESWAKDIEHSVTGVEIDIGIMYRYKKLL